MGTCEGPVQRSGPDNSSSDRPAEALQPLVRSQPFAVPVPGLAYAPLVVGAAHDPAEEEADRTAASIVQRLRHPLVTGTPEFVGRRPAATAPLEVLRRTPPVPGPGASAPPGPGPGETVGLAGGVLPERLTTLIAQSQGSGARLPPSVRADLEPAVGTDLGAVRVHTGTVAGVLNRSMQAQAFTLGADIYFRDGLPDVASDSGLAVLAHEVAHTLQAGSDRKSRRRIHRQTFTPFTKLAAKPGRAAGLVMDKLFFHGLTYDEGGTTGNSVNMEHMVSNYGGSSAPGEPAGIWKVREVDVRLVWGNGQQTVATAMHAINGDFTHGTNVEPKNIFMGSARSNTDLHFFLVERPIRANFQSNPTGLSQAYEKVLLANPPIAHPTKPDVLVWCRPGLVMPGATPIGPKDFSYNHPELPGQVTHVVHNPPDQSESRNRPRFVQYKVTPQYTYSAYPALPAFLMRNIAQSEDLIAAAELPGSGAKQVQIDNQRTVTDYMKKHAHQLFPEKFRCEAVYWVASYLPATPWYQQTDDETFDAQRPGSADKRKVAEVDNADDFDEDRRKKGTKAEDGSVIPSATGLGMDTDSPEEEMVTEATPGRGRRIFKGKRTLTPTS